MATGTYAPDPVFTAWDNNGDPISGALLYTYAAGTTTPLATYSNVGLTVANTNPVVCDSAGRATIFLSSTSYKWILKTPAGVTIWSRDNISGVPSNNIDNDVSGTAGETLTATQVVYLGAGSWSKADADLATSSTVPQIGFVVSDVASADTGSFRLSGRMSGFSGLNPGSDYFVSATAGEITAAPPVNARYVGRADTISSLIIGSNPRPYVTPQIPCGRLTLTTAVPVTTGDVTAATTIYYTPYEGNTLTLYDGTRWIERTFAQVSIAVPATTATVYDLFLYDNAGTVTLEALVWTNAHTRATALVLQDGFEVKTGATTRFYVGSFATTAVSGQTEDSAASRLLYNRYHQETRLLQKFESTASWDYTLATFRQARATATNQVTTVIGVLKEPIHLQVQAFAANAGSAVHVAVAIGEDSTTTQAANQLGMGSQVNNVGAGIAVSAVLDKVPASVGLTNWVWLESSEASSTTSWKSGNNSTFFAQSGLSGWMLG